MKPHSHVLFAFALSIVLADWASAAVSAAGPAYDVRAYGAKGDGTTLDTAAINQAIDAAAAAGGGTVYFPAGTYASYSIHLRSNVALYLDAGATILAADPPAEGQAGGYDAPEPNPFDLYEDFGHSHWHNSLIWGEGLENVSIVGPGRILGLGLSRGFGRKDVTPGQQPVRPAMTSQPGVVLDGGVVVTPAAPFGYPSPRDTLPSGVGNKAIALKNCRNVILRDITIEHGGHFALLAIATDNFTIDNVRVDTNRDGFDIDCCRNVHVSNCTVNSPNDDGICLKSCFGLGYARATENVTITNCLVSGYQEGSLLDGTFKRDARNRAPIGRIKFGTESNGGFKNITISNCVFDYCRGFALESVDGALMEDISISNITMRDIVNAPIFVRLGARLRGPDKPVVGTARRINISNIRASNVSSDHGILIVGLPDHAIEDLSIHDVLIEYEGGGTKEQATREVPDLENAYPEPSRFGLIPSYGLYARHVKGLSLHDVELRAVKEEHRPAVILIDVAGADFDHVKAAHAADTPEVVLTNVRDLTVHNSSGLTDTHRDAVEHEALP